MEILTNFGIQPTLLLAQIVNFAIILFLLKKFFYKPLTRVLEDRQKRIAESLKNAQLIEEKLANTEQNSQKILEEAQNFAQNIISEAKRESAKIIDLANLDARKLADQTLEKTKLQIEKQREEMRKLLKIEILTLVAQVVKKVLGRSLRENERQGLTQKAVSEITKQIH